MATATPTAAAPRCRKNRQRNQSSRHRGGNSPTTCPAALIGRELAVLNAAHEAADVAELEARRANQGPASLAHLHRKEAIWPRIECLERDMTFARPTSHEGALMQLAVAYGEASALTTNHLSKDDLLALGRRLARLLYGLRGFLERAGGIEAEALGAGCYMPAELDPLRALDAARTWEAGR
ncbi:hypothetical protein LPC08_23405 [Roseomonas sp. OT10]|uniref:hypothetical protein n=1 Tax=Roseomonas cutis TaxID=2897332 RepID=UPI001E57E1BF|nr:hypothetical protein [Roseomonas sp. OT10]UFN48124.1 hypothetical protein LPC08_19210 [Roseomonas sp. OT10]UFN48908.1 hypothetical protein LPC08_23405 [Roseomonas sp. OT10]